MPRMLLRLVLFLNLAGLCGSVHAQDTASPSPEFKAWWKQLTEGGALGPNIDGVALTFDVEHRMPIPPTAEVETMRQMVAGKPDHPLREYLSQIDSVTASGYPITRTAIWRLRGEWRLSRDERNPPGAYVDTAWADGLAWRMTGHQLIVDDQQGIETSKYRMDASGTDLGLLVSRSMTCMVSHLTGQGFELLPKMTSNDSWSVSAEKGLPDGGTRKIDARGTWNGRTGTVERCEIVEQEGTGATSRSLIEASDWRPLPNNRLMIAGTASHLIEDGDGSFAMISTLISAETFDHNRFLEVIRIPSVKRDDPIRGKTTYVSVIDKRNGGDKYLLRQDDGAFTDTTSNHVRKDSGTLRALGWATLGLLICAFVWIKIKSIRH